MVYGHSEGRERNMAIMCDKLKKKKKLNVANNYQATAENLFSATQWSSIPVDIEEILKRLEIPYGEKDFSNSEKILKSNNILSMSVQGMVHIDNENIKIFYNPKFKDKNASEQKIRFTLAHELAHSILNGDKIDEDGGFIDLYRTDEAIDINTEIGEMEYEANILAGEILLPTNVFKVIYRVLRDDGRSIADIYKSLSNIFDVSKTVVKAKIDYLQL